MNPYADGGNCQGILIRNHGNTGATFQRLFSLSIILMIIFSIHRLVYM